MQTGELWMGTNQGGINRYNGAANFSYLTTENGLSDNVVYCIDELDNQIFIGTNNGLTVIRGLDTTILNTEKGLPHSGVVSLLVSSKNEIWLGTGKGVAKLIGDSIHTVSLDSSLSASTILNIREAADGSLWFASVQNGVFRWDGKSVQNITKRDGLGHNYCFDVLPLSKHDAWIFNYRGLYRITGKSLKREYVGSLVNEHTIFYGYTTDKAGNIWIGTSGGVLKHTDGKYKLFTKKNGLVNEHIWKLMQDREGNIWFGSKSNGASKLNSERFKIYNDKETLLDPVVSTVMRSREGVLWFGHARKGVTIWEGTGVDTLTEASGLSSENVRDLAQSADGTIYLATNYGFSTYQDGRLTRHVMDENKLNGCRDVFVNGSDVWFGTEIGVAKLINNQLVQISNAKEFSNPVFDGIQYGSNLWFAYDDGILRYDGSKFQNLKQSDGFFDGRCRSLEVGPYGNLWFGTNHGIFMFDGDSCINIGVNQGLISDAVYSLKFDAIGSLWVGQSKGLCRIYFEDGKPKDVIRYGKAQGFMGVECSGNSIWADDDGTVWIGARNGLVEYDPTQDKGLYFKPKTRITAVKVFSQETTWSDYTDSISTSGIPILAELPYSKNHLTFEYSGVSLTMPSSINYSFMLEGLDDDWSPVTNDSKAVYTNIPPGNYTFKVRAGFGDELWNNEPVSVSFTVLPPFYMSSWFFALCALVAFAIAYSYFTIRRANVKITKQNVKIEQQNKLIETKNRNMVDSINYASTIQSATLPTDDEWFRHLPDSFVLYKPKDIVSGDFYWMTKVGDDVFFAAVDCTGHGVPGALMSIIGYNGLNKAVKELGHTRPNEILHQLSQSVNESLRKAEHDNYVRDGMDISLCKLNLKTKKLEFAGSVNPCLIVRNGEQILLKGDRASIGSLEAAEFEFTNHETELKKGDVLFIYSDGYADQFGGAEKKKMKAAVMRSKLVEVALLDPAAQGNELSRYLSEWQGALPQIDDICIIGVKI